MRTGRGRVASLLAVLVVGTLSGVGAVQGQTSPTANVRDHGAVGNGTTNDTAAIQKANDAVAAKGGGTVFFPAGTYSAMGIKQDSNVRFLGGTGAILRHRTGTSVTPIVSNRLARTRGWIGVGSRTLTVESANRMVPGAIVGIRAAGGRSPVQRTTLSGAVTPAGGIFMLRDATGWRTNTRNYLWVEDEAISYLGMSGNVLTGVQRGLFGTKPAFHPAGSPVSQAQGLVAQIVSIVGKTVELDRPALAGVKAATMWTGSTRLTLEGLTFDGKRPADPKPTAEASLVAVRYELARWARVENNTFLRSTHGGITLDQGTSDSRIANNIFRDNGNPGDGMGSAVWLYRGPSANVIENNHIDGDSHIGIAVDDRTVISTEWDAGADDNVVQGNWIEIPEIDGQSGVLVAGSNRNHIVNNDVRSTQQGIAIRRSTQGQNPADSEGNVVEGNRLVGHRLGVYVTGSYNTFSGNMIELTQYPIRDEGTGNTFA